MAAIKLHLVHCQRAATHENYEPHEEIRTRSSRVGDPVASARLTDLVSLGFSGSMEIGMNEKTVQVHTRLMVATDG